MDFLLESLITSKTRLKLIVKFFLNPNTRGYLRDLSKEFGESTNAIRVELNRLTDAGLLKTINDGRIKWYTANKQHTLFNDLHNIVKKYLGIDHLVEEVLKKIGTVELALITGDYAQGIDSGIIDLVIVGQIDNHYLNPLIGKAEKLIKRKIRTLIMDSGEFTKLKDYLERQKILVIWNQTKEYKMN